MASEMQRLRREAVLLRDDSVGVATETTPRKLQGRVDNSGFICSLNPDWLAQINLAEDKAPTAHSVSLGVKPVIVQNPAIIIQPPSVIDGGDF